MANIFNSVKMTAPGKNVFDLSHDVKLSCTMGKLIPTLTLEVLPGDNFTIGCESLIRFAPLIAPVMHRMDVTMHYFYVPNRILWADFEKWIFNEMPDGTFAPYITITGAETAAQKDFMDYMSIPPADPLAVDFAAATCSAFPFAAFQKIYNEYYRDQNLITELDLTLNAGDNTGTIKTTLITQRKRAWEHDYFTACLPFAQKGDAVDIPLGTVELTSTTGVAGQFKIATTHAPAVTGAATFHASAGYLQDGSTNPTVYDPAGTLEVGSTTINDLRRAFRLQEWLEKNARGGTRYAEGVLSHFGIRSDDARLNRPEYITGTKSPVIISEVLQTSMTEDASSPQGNMAGHGVSVTTGQYGKYYAKEHGWIIGIMSIMPKTAYQQGIPRSYIKSGDPLNYYWPSFASIGEQEIYNIELYAYNTNQVNTFGYLPRYSEYKYMPSRVAGEFRNSLSYWHLGRIFSTLPALNQAFVECTPRADIFGVTDPDNVDTLYCHIFHKIKAVRPMPKYGNPTF